MRTHRRTFLLALCGLTLAAFAGSTATANAQRPIIGISDNKASMFSSPLFKQLGVKRARLITPWNSIFTDTAGLDEWIGAARAGGVEPFINFNHAAGKQCNKGQRCSGPSVSEYTRALRAFRARYPDVRVFAAWNEGNHHTQPTGKNPRQAARYYNAMRANCRGCTIVAADVLDSSNLADWLKTFKRYARGNPRLWGLHNYSDTNRFRSTGTRTMLKNVRGSIWLTETGGITYFETSDGRVALPRSEARATKATRYMLALAKKYTRIKRIYNYNWRSDSTNRFDAGLLRPDGSPRPNFQVLAQNKNLIR